MTRRALVKLAFKLAQQTNIQHDGDDDEDQSPDGPKDPPGSFVSELARGLLRIFA